MLCSKNDVDSQRGSERQGCNTLEESGFRDKYAQFPGAESWLVTLNLFRPGGPGDSSRKALSVKRGWLVNPSAPQNKRFAPHFV